MNIPPNSDLVKKTAYDKENAVGYDSYRFTDKSGMAIHKMERGRLFQALTFSPKGARVLEVGCGTGRLMREVFDRGYSVDGADASGPMLEEAAAKFTESARKPELFLCEAANLPAETGSYDLCYSIRLLNQTESPEYALGVVREILRVTKPDGQALIEFVNENRPRWGMNNRPTTRLRPREVRAAAEQAGAQFLGWKGAFFISMQAYKKCPDLLLPVALIVDNLLSCLFPRLCSRVYLHVEKAK